jgi:hypothetical protein
MLAPITVNSEKIFQVLMSVNVMNTVFWDVPPCSLVDIYRYFVRTFYLNFQGSVVTVYSLNVWLYIAAQLAVSV